MGHPPFNPLSRKQLGRTVAEALLRRPVNSLPVNERFIGAGIYAIYYTGPFDAYRNIPDLTNPECKVPIYVGKAIPKGGRVGSVDTGEVNTPALYDRLRKHAASIAATFNLNLEDFKCRYLIVDSIWIPLGEQLVIQQFRPLWNRTVLQGFGINDPGAGRVGQRRSAWDTLHPGRTYAAKLPPNDRNIEEILIALTQDGGAEINLEESEDQ